MLLNNIAEQIMNCHLGLNHIYKVISLYVYMLNIF